MSPLIEFEGKNVEKAVKKASSKLKIPKEDLKYTVVSYGSTGMFGVVGSKKAKISVKQPDTDVKTRITEEKKSPQVNEVSDSTRQRGLADNGTIDELIGTGENILRKIVDLITEDAIIVTEKSSKKIVYRVNGGNSAILIGKHGQTLEAIQYIVEKCMNKSSQDRVRVQVDVNGYLQKRKTNLEGLAIRLAEKSKSNGKPITVGQMNAYERRIVHMALKDDGGVRTQSMGNGSIRKLMIFPKNNKGNNS